VKVWLLEDAVSCRSGFPMFSYVFPVFDPLFQTFGQSQQVGRSCQLPAAPESQADVAFSLASAKVPEDPKAKPGAAGPTGWAPGGC